MLIKKIKIINFRQFMQATEINFPSGEGNVTLIIADNGAGKTTLSQAFLWCLYGETSFKSQNLLNSKSQKLLSQGGQDIVSVSMEIEQNNKVYTITRKEVYTKKGKTVKVDRKDFHISFIDSGGKTELMTKIQSELFVAKLLPKELSSFFFFGGEKIESMSKEIEEGKSYQFREAVNGLAGLTTTLSVIKHFKPTNKDSVYGQFGKEIDKSGDMTLSSIMNEIQNLKFKQQKNLHRIDQIEPEIEAYESKIYEAQLRIDKLLAAEKIENDVKEFEKKINNNNIIKNRNIDSYLSCFSNGSAAFMSLPLIRTALSDLQETGNLDKGIPDMRDTTVKFLLERGFCICGQSLELGSDAYNAVYSLLDVLPPKNIGQLISEFASTAKNKCKLGQDYMEHISTSFTNIKEIDNENEEYDYKRNELMMLATDTSEGKFLRNQVKEYKNTVSNLNYEKADLKNKNDDYTKVINSRELEKSRMSQVSKKNETLLQYMEYAKAVYNNFSQEYDIRAEQVRNDLQNRMNDFLDKIFNGSINITIDSKYNIIPSIVDGEFVSEINSEMDKSTAQGYAIIFAFISALIEMAKEKAKEDINKYYSNLDNDEFKENIELQDAFPLVMDAPLSVFDKTRIKHLCNMLPSIADQVIFFIKDTDGEIAEEHLTSKIGAKYVLNKNELESITTVERII